jgi:hypothetical protein
MSETIEISGFKFEVRRSSRRKTLGLTVDRGGELIIYSPEAAQDDDLLQWASSKLLWVHRKLAIKADLAPVVREPEFVSGESFNYLGRSYRLALETFQEDPLRFDGRRFYLRRDARATARDHFRNWYVVVGKEWIERRVDILARKSATVPARVEVRDLGFRWGSCGKTGVIFFNWKLLQLPVRLADYVLIHELIHLQEPHHGPEFWRAMDCCLADWKVRQEELRKKALEIYWCNTAMVQ